MVGESGLLFDQFMCMGGIGCEAIANRVNAEFFRGVLLAVAGVVSVLLGSLLLRRGNKIAQGVSGSSESSVQRRLFLIYLALVLFIAVFFLAPVVPSKVKSYSEGVIRANIVC
ncbi:MAG TPA: hypothetical protein VEC08_00865 [Nitrososphaerales archaeon]|nr:hypothetical protein [Nitrososphaerales archaeon]